MPTREFFQTQLATKIGQLSHVERRVFRLNDPIAYIHTHLSKSYIRADCLRYFFGLQSEVFNKYKDKNYFVLFICESFDKIIVLPPSFLYKALANVNTANDGEWKVEIFEQSTGFEFKPTGKQPTNVTNYLNNFVGITNSQGKFIKEPKPTYQDNQHATTPEKETTVDLQQLITSKEQRYTESGIFDPRDVNDARERVVASIVRRRGQPEFRKKLLQIYESKCAISGTDAEPALEAAHILPYKGNKTNHSSNGILLRSDLHCLFDLGLIAIDSKSMTVILSPGLYNTTYGEFANKKLHLPKNRDDWPNKEALDIHRQETKL